MNVVSIYNFRLIYFMLMTSFPQSYKPLLNQRMDASLYDLNVSRTLTIYLLFTNECLILKHLNKT